MEARRAAVEPAFCVDLDGALVRTDLLIETAFALFRQAPLSILRAPFWLLRGKAELKRRIAAEAPFDAANLPYNEAVLERVRREAGAGRRIALATAADERLARAVAAHVGLFDDVFASDGSINLAGPRKRDRLVEAYGEGGFDYLANGRVDLPVWERARRVILVSPERGVETALGGRARELLEPARPALRAALRAIRPHQWLKNLLILAPLAAAHRADEPALLVQAALAFLCFCLCASGVYVLNDLLDLDADRRHVSKRARPFASGDLPVVWGLWLAPGLLGAALLLAALLLPAAFLGMLGLYLTGTLLYSFWFKRIVLLDAITLAGLYTARILAGGAAVGVALSFWLLAFSMFFFLSLAMVKRYTELRALQERGGAARAPGRGYEAGDLETIAMLGGASGYISVLVLALYVDSDAVTKVYRFPEAIWLVCPALLYWVSRIWLGARRGKLHDDPVVFAARDGVSRWLFAGILVVFAFATAVDRASLPFAW